MKKKILSVIVTVVFVLMSLLSTSVTVFAQYEEVNQKGLEVLTAIDGANIKDEVIVFEDEYLESLVRQESGKDTGSIFRSEVDTITVGYEFWNVFDTEKLQFGVVNQNTRNF